MPTVEMLPPFAAGVMKVVFPDPAGHTESAGGWPGYRGGGVDCGEPRVGVGWASFQSNHAHFRPSRNWSLLEKCVSLI